MLIASVRSGVREDEIDRFRYIKIHPKTKDLSTRPWGITAVGVFKAYSPEPRAKVNFLG